jgi:hypothetical protein
LPWKRQTAAKRIRTGFGHHWTTHGIFVIVLFIVLGYIFSKADLNKKIDTDKTSGPVIAGMVLGGLIIVGFFFKHP